MHVKPNLQAKPIITKDGVNMKEFEVIIFSVEKRKELEKAEYDYGEDHEHIIALGRTQKEAEQSAIKAFRRERPSETPEVVETTEITEDNKDDVDDATLYADENGKELPRQVGSCKADGLTFDIEKNLSGYEVFVLDKNGKLITAQTIDIKEAEKDD